MKYIVFPLFFAVVYFIYAFVHPEWCNYHEQYQMFMFGWDYLADHLSIASGMADYLAEFVVQFFLFPCVGAALWAAMLVGLGLLVWRACRDLWGSGIYSSHIALCMLPSVLLAFYCGNQYMMLAFPMSLIIALSMFLIYNRIGACWRIYAQILFIALVYWLIGYGVFVYAVLCGIADARRFFAGRIIGLSLVAAYALVAVLAVVVCGFSVMRQYPWVDLFCGVNFYRDRLVVPAMQHYTAISLVLTPCIIGLLPRCGRAVSIAEAAVAVAICPALLPLSHNAFTYQLIKIDYLVRNQRWGDIISLCSQDTPYDIMAYSGLNLALAKTNQLPDRMFEFEQMGQEGLLGNFQRNMMSCVATGEVFRELGLVEQCLRVFFDSQAAIPNCNRSARFSQRIAECYILDRRYDVAAKYLRQLSLTLFYSQWASEAQSYLYHPEQLASNSEWDKIQHHRFAMRTLYSTSSMSDMLLRLYRRAPENQLALQYAMACDLLNGDIQHFMQNFPLTQPGREVAQYSNVPKAYQEALVFGMLSQNPNIAGLPPFVSQDVLRDLRDFDSMMRSGAGQKPSGRLYATFWRYLVQNNSR